MDEIAGLITAKTTPAAFRYALFERVNPERNEARYYYLAWQATLFDAGAVVRLWPVLSLSKGGARAIAARVGHAVPHAGRSLAAAAPADPHPAAAGVQGG